MYIMKAAATALLVAISLPSSAQTNRELRRAADAAIVSDIAREKQAEREAARQPYGSPGHGSIQTANAAREACAAKARDEAGPRARVIGRPAASNMSTGWEVEGALSIADDGEAVPFICSVRNGSVSSLLLNPDR